MSQLRNKVLKQFKNLHRARLLVFDGDERALTEARKQINEKFKQNRDINDAEEIEKLVKFAKDVEIELRTNVIQAVENKPGVYEVRVTKDTPLLDNKMFKEDAIISPPREGTRCGEEKKEK